MQKTACALAALIGAMGGGCGSVSDETNRPAPMLVTGGAIGGGHINGYLNVYVTDGDTNAVIPGARVSVDGSSCINTTDQTGLATFDPMTCSSSLHGSVMLNISATGYSPSTALGVNGANVTMTLQATTRPTPPQATVSGTIAGWDGLPAPASGHTLIGYVAASQTDDLGDLANNIAQGTRDISIGGTALTTTIAANSCARNALVDDCNWKLAARTGAQAHFAVILDSYDNGTPNDSSDDVTTLVGWAVLTGLNLSAGQTVTNEALPMISASDMQTVSTSFPSLPAGMTYLQAYPAVELPNGEGRIPVVFPVLTASSTVTGVPKIAGATYDLLATAQATKSASHPQSTAWVHGFSTSATAAVTAWQLPPTGLTAQGASFSFEPAPGATVHSAEFQDGNGNRLWDVTILDGSTSFDSLYVDAFPAGTGTVTMVVTGLTIPGVDLTNVQFQQVAKQLTAASSDQVTFMP
jgi:hypothetical protein